MKPFVLSPAWAIRALVLFVAGLMAYNIYMSIQGSIADSRREKARKAALRDSTNAVAVMPTGHETGKK